MDLNRIALWFAALPALSLLWRSARGPQRAVEWMVVSGCVLVTALAGLSFFPNNAGYAAGIVAIALMLLPTWARNAAVRASEHQRFGRARWLSVLAACLHPTVEFRVTPEILRAFELAHAGSLAEAEALLQVLARRHERLAPVLLAQRLRLLGRWRELKSSSERQGLLSLRAEPALVVLYARSLGELGFVDDLARLVLAQEGRFGTGAVRDSLLLYLFAFTGQVELTARLLATKGNGYSSETRESWLAVAYQSAGRPLEARHAFGKLQTSADADLRARAGERFEALARALPEEPPSPGTLAIVRHFAGSFQDRQLFMPTSSDPRAESRVTRALVLINAAVFVLGSFPRLIDTRADFADRWAFFAPEIFAGQWWRTLSYLFVHANAIHLLMNLGGLWVLGPIVERAFGRARFVVIYLTSGIVGSAAYLLLARLHWIEPEPLVGASGSIMGLLGANIAATLRAWLSRRAPMAKQLFFRLLAVVALQVAFDYTTPQVAGLAHALGLMGGFLCALVLPRTRST